VLAGLAAFVLLAGAAAGWWNRERQRVNNLDDLMADAARCAVAFEAVELRQLANAKADTASPAYAAVKARLMRMHDAHPAVRYVYLFRFVPATNQVLYLADSAPPGSKDESLPGDEYENFKKTDKAPGLRSIIADHRPATEGPEADEFGEWITGYAIIGDPPPAGTSLDILGLDIDAATWSRDHWIAALTAMGYVWVLLGLPLAALFAMRRQLAQREALRNLSEAMEQSQSAMLIVDLDSRIEYANAGLCRQIGYSRRELLGRPWRDFQVPDTPPALLAEMVATVRAGRPWTGEWNNRRKSGETYPVGGVVTPVKDRAGRISSFVAVFDDMTAAKDHEVQLREALRRAEAGDQAKGRFLATMSHELHTPLNGIVGFTSLLSDTALTAEQRECVETIRLSADALLHLTGDVLDYSRIEADRIRPEPVSCDPRDLVEETLDLLATQAADKKLVLLHRTAPDVPALVSLDAGRTRQALVNLVSNALKFTPAGEVEVVLRCTEASPARLESDKKRFNDKIAPGTTPASSPPLAPNPASCLLEFAVRDTGTGIAPDDQVRLFQPFSQLDNGLRRRHGGAGLGLAISRHLARLLGGDLTVTSTLGTGATFRLVVAAIIERPPPGRGTTLARRRIALVCPHVGLRAELTDALATLGAEVLPCEPTAVAATSAELIIADCDDAILALAHANQPPAYGWLAGRAIGLVHSTHTANDRQALRKFFGRLIGKPLHHSLLAGLFDTTSRPPLTQLSRPQLGLRLLLVDDNPVNLRLLSGLTASLGCEATTANSGPAALALLATSKSFDALLLDIHMPDMDGLEVVRRIRASEAGSTPRNLWIVMVTADQRPDMRDRAFTLGASDFLLKPVTIETCLAALRRRSTTRSLT
jgi:PAS domain S-box-containing protein